MKVLVQHDGGWNAHYFERLGLVRAFQYSGYEAILWDKDAVSPFDIFDQFNPDIFIGQTYNLTQGIIQLLKEKPSIKTWMKAGDYGEIVNQYDLKNHEILVATDDNIRLVKDCFEKTGHPNFIGAHYNLDREEETHGFWERIGPKPLHSMLASDIFEHTNSEPVEEFKSDISFVGGYWGYKAKNFSKYLLPLCSDKYNYNIKIFGGSDWPVSAYCGNLHHSYTKTIHKSAKICPNISEPHAQKYGIEMCERPFKLLSNKCFCISDYATDLSTKILTDGIVYAESPTDFHEKIEYYIGKEEERNRIAAIGYDLVMSSHTYFHRASYLMKRFGLEEESKRILVALDRAKQDYKL